MLGRLGIALLGGVVAQSAEGAAVETYQFAYTASIPPSELGTYPAVFTAPREPYSSSNVRGDLRIANATWAGTPGSASILGISGYQNMQKGHFASNLRSARIVPQARGDNQTSEVEYSMPCRATTRLRGLVFTTWRNGTLQNETELDEWTASDQSSRTFRVGQHGRITWEVALAEHWCETGKSCVRPLRAVGNDGKCGLLEIFTQELREI